MIAREATWGDLHVGAYMRDKNGVAWKVISDLTGELEVVNRDGKKAILKPRPAETPVTLLVPAPVADPEALLISSLGASVMGRKINGSEAWSCAPFEGGTFADKVAHLQAFHRIAYPDTRPTEAEVAQIHDLTHHEPKQGHTAHHHRGVE